jgi:cytoskeletal protein RodZ
MVDNHVLRRIVLNATVDIFNLASIICYGNRMSSVMKKLREDHSLDIKEIAAATRIKESYLKSIENEQYEKLPIEVYARGYIKVYAKYLGVPFETALEPYEKYLEIKAGPKEKKTGNCFLNPPGSAISESEKDEQEETAQQRIIRAAKEPQLIEIGEKEEARAWYYKPRYSWKGLLLIVVLCVVVFELITSGGSRKDAAKQTVAAQPQSKPMVAQEDALKQEQPNSEIKKPELSAAAGISQAQVQAVETARPPDNQSLLSRKHVLVFSATEKTWLQLLIDGKDKVEVMMEPGESLSYYASRSISGIVGNGGGVKVKFNGKPLPTGEKGEVIYLNLPENKPNDKIAPSDAPKVKPEKNI